MSTLNLFLQSLHNLTRWALVLLGLIVIIRRLAARAAIQRQR